MDKNKKNWFLCHGSGEARAWCVTQSSQYGSRSTNRLGIRSPKYREGSNPSRGYFIK